VLNLLPIPGLDGYAIIEPYLSPETRNTADKIKPWGMLGVIVILQLAPLRDRFFDLVLWLYDLSGAPRILYSLGYSFFQFLALRPRVRRRSASMISSLTSKLA